MPDDSIKLDSFGDCLILKRFVVSQICDLISPDLKAWAYIKDSVTRIVHGFHEAIKTVISNSDEDSLQSMSLNMVQ